LTVNYVPAPTATSLTPSNTVLDSGQYETYNVIISGGTSPFTANLIYVSGPGTVNGITAGNVVESLTNQQDGIVTFPSFNSFSATGSYTFNVVATGSATTPVTFNAVANTVTVHSALGAPGQPYDGLSPVDLGQDSQIYANPVLSGGTPPFSYKLLFANSTPVPGAYIVLATSSAVLFQFPANVLGTDTLYMVEATDSASSPETTYSPPGTGNIVVNTDLIVPNAPTLSATAIDANQTITYNALVTTGTPEYNYTWYMNGDTPYWETSCYAYHIYTSAQTVSCSAEGKNLLSYYGYNSITIGIGFKVVDSAEGIVGPYAYQHQSASSPSAVFTISPQLSGTLGTPIIANTLIDMGQAVAVGSEANDITGGTSPLKYSLSASSSQSGPFNTVTGANCVLSGSEALCSYVPTASGTYYYEITVQDSATTPETQNSIPSSGVVVNSALSPTSISSPSSAISLDSGQSYTISVTPPTTGTSPYTYSWAIPSSYSCPGFTTSPGNVSSFTYTPSTSSSASCEFAVTVTDSASTPESYTAYTHVITVYPALSLTVSPASVNIDSGQNIIVTAVPTGGTGSYTYSWSMSSGLTDVSGGNSDSTTATFLGTNNNPSSTISAGVSVSVTDSSANAPTDSGSSQITINSVPTATSFTSSNAVFDSGQYETYNVILNGGTLPITANLVLVSNAMPLQINGVNAIPGETVNTIMLSGSGSPVSNVITFNTMLLSDIFIGNKLVNFEVNAIDSATTPYLFESQLGNIELNPAPTATSLTPSNSAINSGQYVTYNVIINGGTLPITANLVLVSNSLPIQINGANAIPGTTYNTIVLGVGSAEPNTITFNSLQLNTTSTSGGDVVFEVNAIDSASSPFSFNSAASTITINAVHHSSGSATYSFTLSDNINSTLASAQPVYTVYESNRSVSYYQNQLPLTLSLSVPYLNVSWACNVSIGSNTYAYQNDVYGLGFGIQCGKLYSAYIHNMESIYSISAPTITNVTSTSTTTIPPTTTITPASRSITLSGNMSSAVPLSINFTNMHVFVVLTTSSSTQVQASANITNETSYSLPYFANYTLISALNVSVSTGANVSTEVTSPYPCGINSSLIKPFEIVNGAWIAIMPFSVNATSCTVSFVVPKDPILGIFQKTVPATTTVTTTIKTTATIPAAPGAPSPESQTILLVIAIVIVIIIIAAIAAYGYSRKGHKKHG
jgi:hypothetical protein